MFRILGNLAFKFDECFEFWGIYLAISANVSNFGTLQRPARLILESVTSQNNTFSKTKPPRAQLRAQVNAAAGAKRTLRKVLSSAE